MNAAAKPRPDAWSLELNARALNALRAVGVDVYGSVEDARRLVLTRLPSGLTVAVWLRTTVKNCGKQTARAVAIALGFPPKAHCPSCTCFKENSYVANQRASHP